MSELLNNEFVKAGANIQQTASTLMQFMTGLLKPYKLTFQQYNVLRILSRTHPAAISISDISTQMIDPNSNASRLVDKLCSKKYCDRTADANDGRKVLISINESGLKIASETSLLLDSALIKRLDILSEHEARQLNEWLDKLN